MNDTASAVCREDIPSSVSFIDLVKTYDRLLMQLNASSAAVASITEEQRQQYSDRLGTLRLVCSLLLSDAVMWTEQRQRAVLESTARRAQLLQQCIGTTRETYDDEAALLAVHVEVSSSSTSDLMHIEWSLAEDDDNFLLSINKEDLAAEEELLLQMANTPIPTVQILEEENCSTTISTIKLQNRLREEWGNDLYNTTLIQHSH